MTKRKTSILVAAIILFGVLGFFLPNPLAFLPCTSTAYGVPFPFKILYCLCEKGRVEYSVYGGVGNIVLMVSMISLVLWRAKR